MSFHHVNDAVHHFPHTPAPQDRLEDLRRQPTAIQQTHMGHTRQETRLNTFHLRSIHLGGQIGQNKVSDVQVLSRFDLSSVYTLTKQAVMAVSTTK